MSAKPLSFQREELIALFSDNGVTSADKALSVEDVMSKLDLDKSAFHVTANTLNFLSRQGAFVETADKKYYLK